MYTQLYITEIIFLCSQDYMGDSHGKEINLMQTTVKIPGQHKPRLNTQLSNGSSANDQTGNSQDIFHTIYLLCI